MSIELIRDLDGFRAIRDQWEELLANSRSDNIFLTFEWLDSWLTVFNDQFELYLVLQRDGSTLGGAAPLVVDKGGRLTFIGSPQADYTDIVISNEHPESLNEILDLSLPT